MYFPVPLSTVWDKEQLTVSEVDKEPATLPLVGTVPLRNIQHNCR